MNSIALHMKVKMGLALHDRVSRLSDLSASTRQHSIYGFTECVHTTGRLGTNKKRLTNEQKTTQKEKNLYQMINMLSMRLASLDSLGMYHTDPLPYSVVHQYGGRAGQVTVFLPLYSHSGRT